MKMSRVTRQSGCDEDTCIYNRDGILCGTSHDIRMTMIKGRPYPVCVTYRMAEEEGDEEE